MAEQSLEITLDREAAPLGSESPVARRGPWPAAASARAILEAEFDRLYGLVFRYLAHRFFDRDLAEELTAQTLYQAARTIHRVGADRRAVQAWLLRIAANAANTHLRRRRVWQLITRGFARSGPPVTETPAAAETRSGLGSQRVRAALLALPPKHQSVVVLRYYTRLSYEEIAAVLGCRPDAARARLSRALKELRERLDSLPVTD